MTQLLSDKAQRFIERHHPEFLLDTDQPKIDCPYYHLVPKDMQGNLEFRQRMLEEAERDPEAARELWIMCSRDFLFYINTFCWIYEPRQPDGVIPFITYPYQDEVLRIKAAAVGERHINEIKSRDVGASWMALILVDWFCRFRPMTAIGLVSRNEVAVWRTGDSDTLLWKLDFLQDWTPAFLKGDVHPAGLVREYANGSSVTGWSATGDTGRGGRKLFVVGDEAAFFDVNDGYRAQSSLQKVTNTYDSLSTPNGATGAFYDRWQNTLSKACRIIIHWSIHPIHGRGLYSSIGGQLVILDEEYEFPADYDFILDGKLRSVYYDEQCAEYGIPWMVAQELDLDFMGSQSSFFDTIMLDRLKRESACSPRVTGNLGYDLERFEPEFNRSPQGLLQVWCQLDSEDRPHGFRQYAIGADIAAGTEGSHSSNSTISVQDVVTGEEVATFASNAISPQRFAQFCVALCKWFHNAYLVPEANGVAGAQFMAEIARIEYMHVYYRVAEGIDIVKKTRKPGFWTTEDNKPRILGELNRRLSTGEFISHDLAMIQECRQYVFSNGQVHHASSLTTQDASSKGKAHGDRVIAAALSIVGADEVPKAEPGDLHREFPSGSMGNRLQLAKEQERKHLLVLSW